MLRYLLSLLLISVLARDALALVGSEHAMLGDFNWMGSLRNAEKMHVCGLVLAHRNWVLTSGHCVGGTGFTLEFGHVVRGGGYIYPYESVFRHPMYDDGVGYYPNDIAFIYVSGSGVAIEHLYTEPVNSFDNASVDFVDHSCWVAGWGALSYGDDPSSQLQKAELSVISDVDCAAEWGTFYNPTNHVCGYNETTSAAGLCQKDEGGSLVCQHDGVWSLVGLGSFFFGSCEPSYPSVFVRISSYGQWACDTTSQAVCW